MRAPIVNPFLQNFFFSPFCAKGLPPPPHKVGRIGKSPRPFDRRLFAPRRGGCAPSPSEAQICILHKVLHAVEHQRIGDTVFSGVLRHIPLEKAQVEDVDFRVVLHGELGKGVAVGVFNKQELAVLSAALNNGLCLVGVQKHGVLVAAGQVFPLVDAVRLILTVVVGYTSIYVLIPCGDLLGGDRGQRDFIPSCTVEIIAEYFLRPLPRRRFNVPPRTVSVVGPKAGPVVVSAVVDVLIAVGREGGPHIHRVHPPRRSALERWRRSPPRAHRQGVYPSALVPP